jgi:hypothetical protein
MKKQLFLFLIIVYNFGYTQPGPIHKNLNEDFSDADAVVIDSTSSLSRIDLLRNKEGVVLNLQNLTEFPKEFKDFTKTKYLFLSFWKTGITDLSFLNQFPNLTHLRIWNFEGYILSTQPLKLDSLTQLEISYCSDLHNIESISNLDQLEKIRIDNCAFIKQFPRFGKNNSVKKLTLDHMSNGRYFNEATPKNYKTAITNIGYLNHLEDLTLGSLVYLNEIPSYLPKSMQRLEITGWALHHGKGDKVSLKSVANLKLYPNLKELKLYDIYLEKFTGSFGKVSLDALTFWHIPNLTDISGAFMFKSVNQMAIDDCMGLKTISGTRCTNFKTIEIHGSPNIENIDFLFTCPKINTLNFTMANMLRLPNRAKMDNISNLSISNDNQKIELYKKDNEWIKY